MGAKKVQSFSAGLGAGFASKGPGRAGREKQDFYLGLIQMASYLKASTACLFRLQPVYGAGTGWEVHGNTAHVKSQTILVCRVSAGAHLHIYALYAGLMLWMTLLLLMPFTGHSH